jgi:hypothetical protein
VQWQCKLCESHSLTQAYDLGACALLECSARGFRFIDYLDSDWASVNVIDEAAIAKTVEIIKSGLGEQSRAHRLMHGPGAVVRAKGTDS